MPLYTVRHRLACPAVAPDNSFFIHNFVVPRRGIIRDARCSLLQQDVEPLVFFALMGGWNGGPESVLGNHILSQAIRFNDPSWLRDMQLGCMVSIQSTSAGFVEIPYTGMLQDPETGSYLMTAIILIIAGIAEPTDLSFDLQLSILPPNI